MKRSQCLQILVAGICFLSFWPLLCDAQNVFEGQVISKTSELTIPDVNVRLVNEKITTSTNAQGYFRLTTENAITSDTLVFSYVGYQTYKVPVSRYQNNTFIVLSPVNTTLEEVNITNEKLKVVRLNKFDLADIKEDKENFTTPFTPVGFIFAKLFTAPQGNVVLANVEIGRREIDVTRFPEMPLVTSHGNARFLLHVMSVDPNTREPGDKLFSKTINLTDKALWIKMDLTGDNIVITPAEFYIAIEWLPIAFNEVIKLNYSPKVRKTTKKGTQLLEDVSEYNIRYEPALIEYKGKTAVSWIKNGQKWIRHDAEDHRSGREIALSATIHY